MGQANGRAESERSAAPYRIAGWSNRLSLLVHTGLATMAFAVAGLAAVQALGGTESLGAAIGAAIVYFRVVPCLWPSLVVGPDQMVVRNRWRTTCIPRADVVRVEPRLFARGLIGGYEKSLAALFVVVDHGDEQSAIRMEATLSFGRAHRSRALATLRAAGVRVDWPAHYESAGVLPVPKGSLAARIRAARRGTPRT